MFSFKQGVVTPTNYSHPKDFRIFQTYQYQQQQLKTKTTIKNIQKQLVVLKTPKKLLERYIFVLYVQPPGELLKPTRDIVKRFMV